MDENLPAELAELFRDAGHDAVTVLDQELGGADDREVASVSAREQLWRPPRRIRFALRELKEQLGLPHHGRERPAADTDLDGMDLRYFDVRVARQSSPGMIRRMNSSNMGTVKAVSPWLGLQIMPLLIS